MSKRQRYRAAGRRWSTPYGLVTSPFPGAKTLEDVGRILLHNKGKAQRYFIGKWHPRKQQALRRWKKTTMGGQYKRLVGQF